MKAMTTLRAFKLYWKAEERLNEIRKVKIENSDNIISYQRKPGREQSLHAAHVHMG